MEVSVLPKTLFLRWVLLVSVVFVAAVTLYAYGGFAAVYRMDASRISFVIMAVFAGMTVWCGILTWKLDELFMNAKELPKNLFQNELQDIANKSNHVWFAVALCQSLGLLGTIWGFMMILPDFQGLQSGNQESIQKLIEQISYGMSTAFLTTLVGLICSIILGLQHHQVVNSIDRVLE